MDSPGNLKKNVPETERWTEGEAGHPRKEMEPQTGAQGKEAGGLGGVP